VLCRVADRAMWSLHESVEAVLQYLEAAQAAGSTTDDPMLLAAVRVVGRYLQAPSRAAKQSAGHCFSVPRNLMMWRAKNPLAGCLETCLPDP
jgi:hypothetical protein